MRSNVPLDATPKATVPGVRPPVAASHNLLGGQAGQVYAQGTGLAIAVALALGGRTMHKRFLVALLAVVIAGVLIPAVARAQAPAYLGQWGTYGSGSGQFRDPNGVAVDGNGMVISDNYYSRE